MPARTKAAKLAAKRGRPQLYASSNTREPNGRLSRRQQRTVAVEEQEHRDNIATVARTRMRHFNIKTIEQAADPRHGYLLGRMFLDKNVNDVQHEAGIRYAEDMARYYGLTGVPFPSARAQNLFAVRSTGGEDSQSRADRAREASKRMAKLRDILLGCGDINTGRRVEHTVKLVCVEDIDECRDLPQHMVAWLRRGLNSLALFYGVLDSD